MLTQLYDLLNSTALGNIIAIISLIITLASFLPSSKGSKEPSVPQRVSCSCSPSLPQRVSYRCSPSPANNSGSGGSNEVLIVIVIILAGFLWYPYRRILSLLFCVFWWVVIIVYRFSHRVKAIDYKGKNIVFYIFLQAVFELLGIIFESFIPMSLYEDNPFLAEIFPYIINGTFMFSYISLLCLGVFLVFCWTTPEYCTVSKVSKNLIKKFWFLPSFIMISVFISVLLLIIF